MKPVMSVSLLTLMIFGGSAQAAEIGVNEICRAAIGTLFHHDPRTIKIDRVEEGISYLSYVRVDDGTLWSYRCKIEGNQVIWASDTGRWRTHSLDEQVIYELDQDRQNLKIELKYSSGSSTKSSFSSDVF